MENSAARRHLLQGLDDYLEGRTNFQAIYPGWYFEFVDLPEEALAPTDFELLYEVQEKLEFTTPDEPDAEERQYGWINAEEFRAWLSEHRKKLAGCVRQRFANRVEADPSPQHPQPARSDVLDALREAITIRRIVTCTSYSGTPMVRDLRGSGREQSCPGRRVLG